MRVIRAMVADELRLYGLNPRQALNVSKGDGRGGRYGDMDANTGREGGAQAIMNARGGVHQFGRPGQAGRDTIHSRIAGNDVVVGAGEGAAVLTRHQQADINQWAAEKGYSGFADYMKSNRRPHYMATGGLVGKMASGGIVGIPWAPGEEIAAAILPIVTQLHNRFGAQVSDAYDRDRSAGHKSPGHNVTGTAVDFVPGSGGWDGIDQLVAWAVKQGYTSYYDGSFGSINLPPHGRGHHAHVEFGGGGGAAAAIAQLAPKLKKLKVTGPDSPLKSIVGGGLGKVQKAAQAAVEKAVGATMAAEAPG